MKNSNAEDFVNLLRERWTDAEYEVRRAQMQAICTHSDLTDYLDKLAKRDTAYQTYITARYVNNLYKENEK